MIELTVCRLVYPPKLAEIMTSDNEKPTDWNEVNQYETSRPHLSPVGAHVRQQEAIMQVTFPMNMRMAREFLNLPAKYPDSVRDKIWTSELGMSTTLTSNGVKPRDWMMAVPKVLPTPLGTWAAIEARKMIHVFGSQRASMTWDFFQTVFLVPVRFPATRLTAAIRCSSLRKRAVAGVSGKYQNRNYSSAKYSVQIKRLTTPHKLVTEPKTVKIRAQGGIAAFVTWPMP